MTEPEWITVQILGSEFEHQVDINADPSAPDHVKVRYRPRSYSGEETMLWLPGLPPSLARGGV